MGLAELKFYNLDNNYSFNNYTFKSNFFNMPLLQPPVFFSHNTYTNNNFLDILFSTWNSVGLAQQTNSNPFFDTQPTYNTNSSTNFVTNIFPLNNNFNLNGNFDTFQMTTIQPLNNGLGSNGISQTFQVPRTISLTSNDYADLTREKAIAKAKKDPNLEELKTTTSKNGHRVIISDSSFINDIPFARKGTMGKLLAAADKIGRDITVTSALGTLSSPHSGAKSNIGHYDPLNPKLDFGGGLSQQEAERLKTDLLTTGYFASINVESDGATSHLDVKLA